VFIGTPSQITVFQDQTTPAITTCFERVVIARTGENDAESINVDTVSTVNSNIKWVKIPIIFI